MRRKMFLVASFLTALSICAAEPAAVPDLAGNVQKFLQAEGTDLLGFDKLNNWFPPDVEIMMAENKTPDFQEIFDEYAALKVNMKNFSAAERVKRVLAEGVLDFAVERCDLDADGVHDLMIQDNRGLVFFFNGKGTEPLAAMHAPVMSSTEEDMNSPASASENIAARMKFSPEDGCVYLGYEPNSGAISCFKLVDGKLLEDMDSIETLDP